MSKLKKLIDKYNLHISDYIDLSTYSTKVISEDAYVKVFSIEGNIVAQLKTDVTVPDSIIQINKNIIIDLNEHSLHINNATFVLNNHSGLLFYGKDKECSRVYINKTTPALGNIRGDNAYSTVVTAANVTADYIGIIKCGWDVTISGNWQDLFEVNIFVAALYAQFYASAFTYRTMLTASNKTFYQAYIITDLAQVKDCSYVAIGCKNTTGLYNLYISSTKCIIRNCTGRAECDSDSTYGFTVQSAKTFIDGCIIHTVGHNSGECYTRPLGVKNKRALGKGKAIIRNCDLSGRHSAIGVSNVDAYIENCLMSSPVHGPYISSGFSSTTGCYEGTESVAYFKNCTIRQPKSARIQLDEVSGGAMYVGYGASAYIDNCIFDEVNAYSICFNQRNSSRKSSTVYISNTTLSKPIRGGTTVTTSGAPGIQYSTLCIGEGNSAPSWPKDGGKKSKALHVKNTNMNYGVTPLWVDNFVDSFDDIIDNTEETYQKLKNYANESVNGNDVTDTMGIVDLCDYITEYDRYKDALDADLELASPSNIQLKVKGSGAITVRHWDEVNTYQLTDEEQTITLENKSSEEFPLLGAVGKESHNYTYDKFHNRFFINNIENISSLDVSGSQISELLINKDNSINKLVIYNNNIKELDVSHCKELQFLHMFNNPVCSDKSKMQAIIKQLPDRNEKPFGSIILYDWVNLGLCGYRKAANGLFYHDKEYKYPLKPYANEIYRDIASIEHPWYQYIDGKFKELTDYNRMIMIRRELEGLDKSKWTYTNKDGSIFKNWVFGSAIQYNEEAWKYCDVPFRNAHIADVWETAEKGEGVGITSEDRTRFNTVNINFSRVFGYSHPGYPNNGNQTSTATTGNVGIAPIPVYTTDSEIPDDIKSRYPWIEPGCYKLFSSTGTSKAYGDSHGDNCYSFMGSRGVNKIHKDIYGIAPESRFYLYSLNSTLKGGNTSWAGLNDYRRMLARAVPFNSSAITRTALTSSSSKIDSVNLHDINVLTRSLGNFAKIGVADQEPQYHWQAEMCTEIFKSMSAFNSQGNSGDGLPFTTDQGIDSGTDKNDPAQLGAYTMGKGCNWVSSLNRSTEPSLYSSNDRSDKPFTYSYSCYGESVRVCSPYTQKIITSSGTSYATPLHSAETALLRVIFSKLFNYYRYNTSNNYWYCENGETLQQRFKTYADAHMDHMYSYGRSAVGLGTIDMLCNSLYNVPDTLNTTTHTNEQPHTVGEYVNIYQITETDDNYSVNAGHYGYGDINSVIFTNKEHSKITALTTGNHQFKVYNHHRNIIDNSESVFGTTDDVSKNKWWSESNIVAETTTDYSPIADGLIYNDTNYSAVLLEDNIIHGWTMSFGLQYTRNTSSSARTLLCYTDDFTIQSSVNTTSSREKVMLQMKERNANMEDDMGYSYLGMDCWLNKDTTHRFTGYLGDVKDKLFILTIVKREFAPVYDIFMNGQYITSHTATNSVNYKGDLSNLTILPTQLDGTSYDNSHFNCIRLCIHNKPLNENEIVQHSLYMLQNGDKA